MRIGFMALGRSAEPQGMTLAAPAYGRRHATSTRTRGDAMTKSVRKDLTAPPRSAWNTMLDASEGETLPTQAGEVDEGFEDGLGGGDKGIDAETGSGGYGGDAAEAGYEEAIAQPDRPLDAKIHGDPRTSAGEFYPDDEKKTDLEQTPLADELEEMIEEDERDEDELDEG
jgi:hypothetical protein